MNNRFTILVVDDSMTQLAVLRDALEERGYCVATAGNGMEAMFIVQQSPPDLILSDVVMPELNGYHLCRLLKNDTRTAHIPIILLTNLTERNDRFWGEKAGADRYLEKSGDLGVLFQTVSTLLPPHPTKPRGEKSVTSLELTSEDVRSRVTGILDRLLYESTVSNEILKLTSLAHDGDALVREFLLFLSVISRFQAAALLLDDGRDKYTLSILAAEPVSRSFLEKARSKTFELSELTGMEQDKVRQVLLQEDLVGPETGGSSFHVLQNLTITDDGEFLAQIVLFDSEARLISEGTRHALTLAADRFLIVARYLRKTREIEEVKADFVSMLVHDLRAPLTGIRGFTDVLAEGIFGSITDDQGGALKNIQNGCERLLVLIDDILDLSKLEAGKMQVHPSPLQIAALTRKALTELTPLFMKRDIVVDLEIGPNIPYVLGDEKQLHRVLHNLLTNASKFTPPGGKITLSAQIAPTCGSPSSSSLQVSVTNSGKSIPVDEQKKLFKRYQQIPTTPFFQRSSGTGLGLAICKEIVTLHCGEIWVESPTENGDGCRFSFSLPLAPG